jgi:uncharacterized repeat protein (TIGR01451 family)
MKRSNLALTGNPGRVCRLLLTVVLAVVTLLWLQDLRLGGPRHAQGAPLSHPSNPGFDLTFIVVADPQFRGPSNDNAELEALWGVYVTNVMNLIDDYDWPSTSQWGWMYHQWGLHQLQGGGDPIATPEFLVVTGDMTMGARQDQLETFQALLECDSAGLDCPMIEYPVYAGLGNHDLPDDSSSGRNRMWDYIASRYSGAGPVDRFYFDNDSYAYSWTSDGYEMYLLQMHRFAGDAEYKPSGLPFLEDHLAAGPNKLVLLFQHYGWDTGWFTDTDRNNLVSAIDGHNVIGIFHGHTHDYYSDETDYVAGTNVYATAAGAPVIHVPAMIDWEEETDPETEEVWTVNMGWFAVVRVTDTYMDIAWVQVAGAPVNFHTWRSVPLNEAPSVDAGANATIDEGNAFTRSASFSDLDADQWTATVDYDDGSGSQPLTLHAFQTFDLNHTYADDGIYTVVVTVTDYHDTSGTDSVRVTVNNLPPTVTSFSKSGSEDAEIAFTAAEFVDNFEDVPADSLEAVGIASLPDHGTLTLDGSPVTVEQAIAAASLDNLVFAPDADWNGTTSFGWSGYDGQAYAAADAAVNITVGAVNDAPVLAPSGPGMTAITEDDTTNGGDLVSTIVGDSITDVDAGALEGIAIYALDGGNGTWQYSTDGGGSWSNVSPVSTSSALLLRSGDRVRLLPDGANGTSASFSYYAWDRTAGTAGIKTSVATRGGTTPFSSAGDGASITVSSVNDAPVLAPAGPSMTSITEDDTANGGDPVSGIVGASITDVDAGALEGVAIYDLDSGNGTWQYSTDGGGSWSNVSPVSISSALLLRSGDRVRLLPDGANGTGASFSYYAWDRTVGTAGSKVSAAARGGTTAFSTASDSASITVSAVNDAPLLNDSGDMVLDTINEDDTASAGTTIAAIVASAGGDRITDVDAGALEGIAVVGADVAHGTWQYSTDGGGSWHELGSPSPGAARLLAASAVIRFVPDADYNGTVDPGITFRAWDQSSGTNGGTASTTTNGGTTAFSAATETASIVVRIAADLAVGKLAVPATVVPGRDAITYTVVVHNPGPSNITGATLTDTLPAALVSPTWTCVASGTTCPTAAGSGNLDETLVLPESSVVTYTISGAVDASATSLANTAHIENPAYEIDAGNDSATVVPILDRQADLSVTKSQSWAGSAITYTIVIRNHGPGDAPGTLVTDAQPEGLDNVNWTCTTVGGAVCGGGGSGGVDDTVDLPAGSAITYTVIASIVRAPVVNAATVTPPVGVSDLATDDNQAAVSYMRTHLPLSASRYAAAPDLVVERIVANAGQVQVVIRNQGNVAVPDDEAHEFWVDVYVDPDHPPVYNETCQTMGCQGAAWGITWSGSPFSPADPARRALPLEPGEVFTLTTGGDYYWPLFDSVEWPLAPGTPVYAQVDSASAATSYGVILENHEITGGAYNNVFGPALTTPSAELRWAP